MWGRGVRGHGGGTIRKNAATHLFPRPKIEKVRKAHRQLLLRNSASPQNFVPIIVLGGVCVCVCVCVCMCCLVVSFLLFFFITHPGLPHFQNQLFVLHSSCKTIEVAAWERLIPRLWKAFLGQCKIIAIISCSMLPAIKILL